MKRPQAVMAGVVLLAAVAGTLGPSNVHAATLQEPQVIQGSVADAVTLEIIPAATVTLVTTGSVTQSGPDGTFVFPGALPGPAALRIEAPGYQTTIWEVEVAPDRVLSLEVLLSRPQDPGTLFVAVRSGDAGEPMAGVAVSIPELDISAATNASGAVVVPNMPQGSFLVAVSTLGYAAVTSFVEIQDSSVALEVALHSEPIDLAPVVIETETTFNPSLERVGFYERRAEGFGTFIDRADIERAEPSVPSDLLRTVPGVELVMLGVGSDLSAPREIRGINNRRGFAGFGTTPAPVRGPDIAADCRMPLFVNGSVYGDAGILDTFPIESIEAIEVYSGTSRIPVQYNTANTNCGLIVVWTVGFNVDTPPAGAAPVLVERDVQLGDEVRIASALASGRFQVAEAGPGGLTLRADAASEPIALPASAITGLEVSLGRSVSLRRGVLYGGATGALVGVIVLATCNMPHFLHYGCLGGASPEGGALISVGLGSLVGLVVSKASDEVWARGRLPQLIPD